MMMKSLRPPDADSMFETIKMHIVAVVALALAGAFCLAVLLGALSILSLADMVFTLCTLILLTCAFMAVLERSIGRVFAFCAMILVLRAVMDVLERWL